MPRSSGRPTMPLITEGRTPPATSPKTIIFDRNDRNDRDLSGETGMINGRVSTHKFRKYIVGNIVQPTYLTDIRYVLKYRSRYRSISQISFLIAFICCCVASVLTFIASAQYQGSIGFVAGIIGTTGSVFMCGSLMMKNESKILTHQANEILKELGIDGFPEIESLRDHFEENQIVGVDNINSELCETLQQKNQETRIQISN